MRISTPPGARHESAGNPRFARVLAMLMLPVLIAAVVACGEAPSPTPAAAKPYANSPEGMPKGVGNPVPDPKEVVETKPAGQLPDFIQSVQAAFKDKTARLYQGAVDQYDAYAHVPCYCGCAIYTHAHKSLAECFIKEKNADGSIVFTDHSTTCDLCQQAAQMTVDGLAAGKPLKDVRADIFTKLKYTEVWTDTPPVP